MGLLGTLLKVGGKIAKGVLSKATYGASDKVLAAAKSLGAAKKQFVRGRTLNPAMQALVNKKAPQLSRIVVTRDAQAGPGGFGQIGQHGSAAAAGTRPRPRGAKRARTPPAARTRRRRAGTRRAAGSGSRRAPPRGGLNLRAMSAAWKAAGKPGTWRDWIRTNQIRNT